MFPGVNQTVIGLCSINLSAGWHSLSVFTPQSLVPNFQYPTLDAETSSSQLRMAGPIHLELLTDLFNKIDPKATLP